MAGKIGKDITPQPVPPRRRARDPQKREDQLVSLAVDLVEERLRNKTATSQEIVYVLKLASEREKKERILLDEQIKLAKAKTEAYESSKRIEELYKEAMTVMKTYSGNRTDE